MNKPLRGCRSGINFGPETETYKLFEAFMLDLPESELPFVMPGLSKGKAINLAMGINRCQIQWGKAQGIPRDMLTRSAKAKEDPTDGSWYLEISASSHQRYSSPDWMKDVLARVESMRQNTSAAPRPADGSPSAESSHAEEPADPITQAIRNTYGDIL